MRLLYIAGIRLPTEKAHGLQIMQNCEAFAENGISITLWVTRRVNTPELQKVNDVWAFYGVNRVFDIRRLPTLDLMSLLHGRLEQLAFYLVTFTFTLSALLGALFTRTDVIYSREPMLILLLGLTNIRRRKIVWEAHSLKTSGRGAWIQRQALRRATLTVAITQPLRNDLLKLHPGANIIVAHDGIRAERFSAAPDQVTARAQAGWPQDVFIAGYVGRLTTYNMTKGIDTLIAAVAALPDRDSVAVALVGGPDDIAAKYRQHWESLGLPAVNFLYAGQVMAPDVPRYLAAFDICAMPFPASEHFRKYTSPLKLFEYMASGRALIASDLPSWTDVLRHEYNALLVAPENIDSFAAAIARLRQDETLRERIAGQAQRDVFASYTWAARARTIFAAINGKSEA